MEKTEAVCARVGAPRVLGWTGRRHQPCTFSASRVLGSEGDVMATRLLRLPAVLEKTGLGRSMLYALMTAKGFPLPLRIGVRAVAWLEDEVDEWIRKRPRGGSERPER